MTTSTKAPTTAAAARALADQLDQQEHELDQRRRQAARVAELAEVRKLMPEFTEAQRAETAAIKAWTDARLDVTVPPSKLIDLWASAHAAIRHRCVVASIINERTHRANPRWDEHKGSAPTPHRIIAMTQDQWSGHQVLAAVAVAIAEREQATDDTQRRELNNRVDQAGADASRKVK